MNKYPHLYNAMQKWECIDLGQFTYLFYGLARRYMSILHMYKNIRLIQQCIFLVTNLNFEKTSIDKKVKKMRFTHSLQFRAPNRTSSEFPGLERRSCQEF